MVINLLLVAGEPNRGVGTLSELADNLVLAVVEDIAENDRMITPGVVTLHPLTG